MFFNKKKSLPSAKTASIYPNIESEVFPIVLTFSLTEDCAVSLFHVPVSAPAFQRQQPVSESNQVV